MSLPVDDGYVRFDDDSITFALVCDAVILTRVLPATYPVMRRL